MMKVRIEKIAEEARDIRSLRLVRVDGQPFDAYEPGAHVDITGPTGVTRQYSLCSPPDDGSAYLVAVKREVQSRGGSQALHDLVEEGAELEIGMPRCLFRLDAGAPSHVLVAAGIGVTPMLSMAYRLQATGQPYRLHYFARGPEFAAFASLLQKPPFADHVEFHFGVEPQALEASLSACLQQADDQAHVYTCGPAPFMSKVVEVALRTRSEEAIHLEHFQADPAVLGAATGGFEVELASSGVVLQVPQDSSLVDVLQAHGCDIDTECREGICGTCIIDVLEGEPEHRDNCLSSKEKASNKQICACVSRAKSSRLVLDL
ncbi:PDR/VanB family oxidoreductase [Pseudomonas segetis]|uniref:Vanillate O-demethylase ferredoxin subunit n=1 Tax=Pseudomonas segetis TaxID=298908 RepID=A0A239HQZ7_9PSED|nr:PDR/VanB family oxidoreductase [Pseudomonas segetis]SNS83742.1 vanillate O-demethylase ferredoxin subunit [Pseudomonas segetis]